MPTRPFHVPAGLKGRTLQAWAPARQPFPEPLPDRRIALPGKEAEGAADTEREDKPQGLSAPSALSGSPRRLPRLPAQLLEAPPTSPPPPRRLAIGLACRHSGPHLPGGGGIAAAAAARRGKRLPRTGSRVGPGGPRLPHGCVGVRASPRPDAVHSRPALGPLAERGLRCRDRKSVV